MQKMKNQIKKFGPDNVFILTARAKESAPAIHEWLKSEGVISPKNITSESKLNLDSPGALKKMANTPSAKRIKRMAVAEATAFKKNKRIAKNTGVISESRTNRELINKAKIVDKALELGAKRNKKARGMSTFDFDETVGMSENYIFATKGKKRKR